MRSRISPLGSLVLSLMLVIGVVPPAQAVEPSPSASADCPAIGTQVDLRGWLDALRCEIGAVWSAAVGPEAQQPSLEQLIGQKLVVRMSGKQPSASLLRRIRLGRIGGVVLLASNIGTRRQVVELTQRLQRAAADGGQPPLLIALDQEGGSVKRVTWAPPTLTVPQMGRLGSTSVARRQGARTGGALRALGINVDLAPVADVPRSEGSFMVQQGRTFSFDAERVARLADAFAEGLASSGVLATMKHFPGIGLAIRNTDHYVDTIAAPRSALASDLLPYRRAIGQDVPLIMLSNVTYTAFDERNAAGWSHAIAVTLLRDELDFTGVTITDSLDGTAHARDLKVSELAFRAASAGTDLILTTGSEKTTRRLYETLLARAREGQIPLDRLRDSYRRIVALKDRLSPP
jgi:beta-N-acetylhexosaminidase